MLKHVIDGISASVFVVFVFCTLILVPLMWLGPDVEGKLFPVVQGLEVIKVESNDPYYNSFNITINASRKCQLLDTIEWYVYNDFGHRDRVAIILDKFNFPYQDITRLNDVKVDNKKYSGKQDILLKYRCHLFWTTNELINISYDETGNLSK